MEQLTKNQAVATSQEAVQNQNEPQLRDENAHNDKSVHGVLNPTYQAGLRRDAVQPDIEAERKKRDEIEAGKSYCSRRFGGATCDDKSAQIYARFDKNDWRIQPAEFYRFHDAEVNTFGDRKSGSAGMPRPTSYAVFCLKKKRHPPNCMFSCLQILEAFLWFVLITLLNVTLIILTLSVSRFLLFPYTTLFRS